MAVYVDDVQHSYGRMKMCHLWADSLEELLEMVDKIGVDRKWIQGHSELSIGKARDVGWVHFDISLSKKALALREGALLTDKYGPLLHTKKLLLKWAVENDREDIAVRAAIHIETIENIRQRNKPEQMGLL